jgi:hypothetical protein
MYFKLFDTLPREFPAIRTLMTASFWRQAKAAAGK